MRMPTLLLASVCLGDTDFCFMFKQTFPSMPSLDMKYNNGWSFNSESTKLSMMIGFMTGCLDRCVHRDLIFFSLLEFVCCCLGSGYSLKVFIAAYKKMCFIY